MSFRIHTRHGVQIDALFSKSVCNVDSKTMTRYGRRNLCDAHTCAPIRALGQETAVPCPDVRSPDSVRKVAARSPIAIGVLLGCYLACSTWAHSWVDPRGAYGTLITPKWKDVPDNPQLLTQATPQESRCIGHRVRPCYTSCTKR